MFYKHLLFGHYYPYEIVISLKVSGFCSLVWIQFNYNTFFFSSVTFYISISTTLSWMQTDKPTTICSSCLLLKKCGPQSIFPPLELPQFFKTVRQVSIRCLNTLLLSSFKLLRSTFYSPGDFEIINTSSWYIHHPLIQPYHLWVFFPSE